MAQHAQDIIESGWDPLPRWLRHTGLPDILGSSAMTVAELLIRQALARRGLTREDRDPDGNALPDHSVPFTREGLGVQIGLGRDAVSRAFAKVQQHHIARQVAEGYGYPDGRSAPSWAAVDLRLIERIYALTCNELHASVGGLWKRAQMTQAEQVRVRVLHGEEPISIDTRLFSQCEWQEVPVPLVQALCLEPDRYDELIDHKRRVIGLEAQCLRRQGVSSTVPLNDIPEELEALRQVWVPKAVVDMAERLISQRRGPHNAA